MVLKFYLFKGEEQKKLDVISNEVFVKALISSGRTVSLLLHTQIVYFNNIF
jgi:fructose-1,6-bisphosphatase